MLGLRFVQPLCTKTNYLLRAYENLAEIRSQVVHPWIACASDRGTAVVDAASKQAILRAAEHVINQEYLDATLYSVFDEFTLQG